MIVKQLFHSDGNEENSCTKYFCLRVKTALTSGEASLIKSTISQINNE